MSTGATMGGTFAPCGGVVDDFNGYASDADFMAIGEAGGPWAEAGQSANVVNWVPTAAIRTHAENGTPGVLHVKNVMSLAGASCAISVRVKNVQNENAFFGFVDQIANPTKLATITMAESAGADVDIEVFGFPSITTELPVDLAVVVSGGQVYGAYDDGTGWKKLPGLPGGALDVATAIGASAYAAMGKTTNGDAFWDDFGTSVPTVLPN